MYQQLGRSMKIMHVVVLTISLEELFEGTNLIFSDSRKHREQVNTRRGRGGTKKEDVLHVEFEKNISNSTIRIDTSHVLASW